MPASLLGSSSVPAFEPSLGRAVRRPPVRPVLLAVTAGLVVFIALTHGGRDTRKVAPLSVQIDKLAEVAGLGITQVSLKGHRFTPDGDIFEALALNRHRSMAGFSITDARARVEVLPWVRKASIARQLPNRLNIEISERSPTALWRNGSQSHLIDRTGRILASVKAGAADHLPLVIGVGGAKHASRVMAMVDEFPVVAARFVAAQWVGERRWTLHLASAGSAELAVHLPEHNPRQALKTLVSLQRTSRILDRALSDIDMRLSRQLTIRPVKPGRPLLLGRSAQSGFTKQSRVPGLRERGQRELGRRQTSLGGSGRT